MPLPGGFANTAQATDVQLQAQLVKQARAVARLMTKRRTLRKALRAVEAALRQERKFLRDLAADRRDRNASTSA